MHVILLNLGALLMVIGIGMVVFQTGKLWPHSKRRAAKPDPSDGPKPSIPLLRCRCDGRRRAAGRAGVGPGTLGPVLT
jgi:hypothetical protein